MLLRLVKMTFKHEEIETFKAFFDDKKETIKGFEGCLHLELWQDTAHPAIFFTYSRWHNERSLNHYRNSAFFKDTWQQTKLLFAAKPEAWSVDQIVVAD